MADDLSNLQALVLAKQAARWRILVYLYEAGGGRKGRSFLVHEVQAAVGNLGDEFNDYFRYLKAEGLIDGDASGSFSLSHKGRVEVETTLTQPAKDTDHFPANIVLTFNTGGGAVTGVVVASPGATQQIKADHQAGPDLAALVGLIRAAAADPAIAEDDRRYIEVSAEQIEKAKDNPERLKAAIGAIKPTLDHWSAVASAIAASDAIGTAIAKLF